MLKVKEINHVSLWVSNVKDSIKFYNEMLGFALLDSRPAFDFDGAWFALGANQQLHILAGRTGETSHSHSRRNHFALEVESLSEAEKYLKSKNINFMGPKPRPDGVMQIFIQDPDGYWLELTELSKN